MSGFSPLRVPLVRTQVIEASAGTGKTHTITTLLLRLLLERELAVSEVLVVTYTRAATAELRARVRTRLRDVHAALLGNGDLDAELVGYFRQRDDQRGSDLVRLASALRNFDDAAIFTIHGFCQRALVDRAFESGVAFDVEFVQDQRPLLREIARDYWARHTYRGSPAWVRALSKRDRPEALERLAAIVATQPDLPLTPDTPDPGPEPDLAPFRAASARAAATFVEQAEAITAALTEGGCLNGNKYRAKTIRTVWLPALASLADVEPGGLPEWLDKLTPAALAAGVNKGKTPPEHGFFVAIADLLSAAQPWCHWRDRSLAAFRAGFVAYVRHEVADRKRTLGVQGFDDLLRQLDRALSGDAAPALAARLRASYPAALIDEFQDTDPVQYRIFTRLYAGTDAPLFLIGDPKQAIYAFRGADVFAYLAAARAAPEPPHGLTTNFRADPGLIAAVNRLFSRANQPFVLPGIAFRPVSARPGSQPGIAGDGGAPLQLLFVAKNTAEGASGASQKLDAGFAKRLLPTHVAAEVTQLLASRARLGEPPSDRAVEPRDIAVLCRTNAQARAVQSALRDCGVPSALEGDSSVFDTPMAEEMQRVLSALVRPARTRNVRAALATSLFGLSAAQILALEDDGAGEGTWDAWLERFSSWHQTWHGRGFVQAFHSMMAEARVQRRLLRRPDGERQLTNLLHLGELLHGAATGGHLGPLSLLAWFVDMRANEESRVGLVGESAQVRLESDDHAVRLTTVHRSKGLEYPIVFCPYLWGDSQLHPGDRQWLRFHDASDVLTLDLGSSDKERHRKAAEREALAEQLRLLYVALTRAKHRCYVVWGALPGAAGSPLAYLLHQGPSVVEADDVARATAKRFNAIDDEGRLADLARLADDSAGAVVVRPIRTEACLVPRPPATAPLLIPEAGRPLSAGFRMLSFSSIVSAYAEHAGRHGVVEAVDVVEVVDLGRDHDASSEPSDADPARARAPLPSSRRVVLHDFPAGTRPGTLIHHVYEHIDFARADRAEIEVAALSSLRRFGYPDRWASPIAQGVHASLQTPLSADDSTLRLDAVSLDARLNELEFTLAVGRRGEQLAIAGVAECLSRHAGSDAERVYAQRLSRLAGDGSQQDANFHGFLRGFMDLVFRHDGRFYIVDYKSNHLGPAPDDYAPERLAAPMRAHHYILQYHLYVVALDRYLRSRLPDYDYGRDFGGVYYLFVRGMDPDYPQGHGVLADRPDPALVRELARALRLSDVGLVAPGVRP